MTESRPSFITYCQNALPFSTKSRRNTHQYLKQFNRPTFFSDEKVKVKGIRDLLNSGNQDLALSLLLKDFANEDGIRYFNKVRHLEGHDTINNGPKSAESNAEKVVSVSSPYNFRDILVPR